MAFSAVTYTADLHARYKQKRNFIKLLETASPVRLGMTKDLPQREKLYATAMANATCCEHIAQC